MAVYNFDTLKYDDDDDEDQSGQQQFVNRLAAAAFSLGKATWPNLAVCVWQGELTQRLCISRKLPRGRECGRAMTERNKMTWSEREKKN